MISNKILLNNIPIFNNFSLVEDGISVSPFVHFNLLYTPELEKSVESKPLEYDPRGLGIGDWGLGIGDWGLGQSPIPNPQSPKILI
jgi:hypothetical protein